MDKFKSQFEPHSLFDILTGSLSDVLYNNKSKNTTNIQRLRDTILRHHQVKSSKITRENNTSQQPDNQEPVENVLSNHFHIVYQSPWVFKEYLSDILTAALSQDDTNISSVKVVLIDTFYHLGFLHNPKLLFDQFRRALSAKVSLPGTEATNEEIEKWIEENVVRIKPSNTNCLKINPEWRIDTLQALLLTLEHLPSFLLNCFQDSLSDATVILVIDSISVLNILSPSQEQQNTSPNNSTEIAQGHSMPSTLHSVFNNIVKLQKLLMPSVANFVVISTSFGSSVEDLDSFDSTKLNNKIYKNFLPEFTRVDYQDSSSHPPTQTNEVILNGSEYIDGLIVLKDTK